MPQQIKRALQLKIKMIKPQIKKVNKLMMLIKHKIMSRARNR